MSAQARAGLLRWAGCFAVVLAAHVAGAAYLIGAGFNRDALPDGAPIIAVSLAPIAAAPAAQDGPPVAAQPAPAPDLPAPPPDRPQDSARTPDVLPPPRPPDIAEHTRSRHAPHRAAAAPQAERRAARASAPAEGRRAADPNALPNWTSRLVAQIERHKRYPADAAARGLSGVAEVAFSVDRRGGVHGAHLVRSTGSALLDRDALAWIARAAPLPPPPADIGGALVPVRVPLRYNFR